MDRLPAVQGAFYPAGKKELQEMLGKMFSGSSMKHDCPALIVPHAGYVYSGKTAAKTISRAKKASDFVIICPNHTGYGAEAAVYPKGFWENALGRVQVDEELGKKLVQSFEPAEPDESAHLQEHSAEVVVPFLQHCFKQFKILPIVLALHDLEQLKKLGKVLAELQKEKSFCLIVSSDFTHFEPEESARQKDLKAIESILALDVDAFYEQVMEKRLSICGFLGIAVLMQYCRELKLKGELIEYTSSAKASRDKSSVVGYAGICFR